MTTSGWWRAARSSASSPVAREVDLVAARLQVDRRARAGSAARRRRRGSAAHVAPSRQPERPSSGRRPACPRPSSSPPIASTKPCATASPSPTPVAVRPVAEPLERLEHRARGRPAGCPGRGRRRAGRRRPPTAPASTRTGTVRRRARRARCRRRWRAPARAAPGRRATRGSVSATSTSTRSALAPRLASAAGDDLVERRPARARDVERAGLEPAHVEQVADEVVEPVGLLVDRLQELVPSPRASSRRRAGAGS